MIILGISCFYHDSAACIVINGKVTVAAAEERFTRIKHDNNFPLKAIDFCLRWLNLSIADIDRVVFYEKPVIKLERVLTQHLQHFPRSRAIFARSMGSWLGEKLKIKHILKRSCKYYGKVSFVPHHLSHAACSYYLSGFTRAVVVTCDGVGEWATTAVGLGQGTKLELDQEIHFPHSLGLLYSTITAYLGFAVNNDEYKVMGLAAYGNPTSFRKHFDQLIKMFPDGSFALNMDYFSFDYSDRMPSYKLELLFGAPTRKPADKIAARHKNIAAALQEKLEAVVFQLLRSIYQKYKIKTLCFGGGVALNSVLNGKISTHTPFTHIFIPPDPGDGGGAIGAALALAYKNQNKVIKQSFSAYLGPSFSDEQIEAILATNRLRYQRLNTHQLIDTVSDLLIRQKIIGWFQGQMEWGPRALGNRSILASASQLQMKDIINRKVKHRELFRPFAPVILEEMVNRYFETDVYLSTSAKYMLLVYPFKDNRKNEAPATVHVDGTGRLQTIARADNPLYYDLIKMFGKKTGTPIVVNTSFNVRGEPIVCTPQDAVNCFLSTALDYLVIGSFIVSKYG